MTEPITHDDASTLLPWYVNGTLDAGERAAVEAHLAHCVACRQELAFLREVAAATAENGAPAPAGFEVRSLSGRLRRAWWLTPAPARGLVAAQAAVIAGLVVWAAVAPSAPVATYATLDEPAPPAAPGGRLQLVFAADTSEERLRAVLLDHGLSLVDGPSPLGVYTVAAEAEGMEGVAAMAEDLLAQPEVRLAAPLP